MSTMQLTMMAALLTGVLPCVFADYYVAKNGQTPAGPYTSWSTAASNIQDAVNAAPTNGVVWVGAGRYTLPTNAVVYDGTNVVHIYKPLSLRSSNGVPGSAVIDGEGKYRGIAVNYPYDSANRFMIDGFTISNCCATNKGAGIILNCGAYTALVQNCLISDNRVVDSYARNAGGGGIHTYSTVFYIISNCTFRGNRVFHDLSTGGGGGVYMQNSSSLRTGTVGRIDNCLFESNTVWEGSGGGLQFFYYGVHEIRNTVIRGNMQTNSTGSAELGGGGIETTYNASVQMWNCLLYNNLAAAGQGGAIYNMKGGSSGMPLVMYNCNIVNNRTMYSGGAGGIECRLSSDSVVMYNSIVCSNASTTYTTTVDVKAYNTSFITNSCITSTNLGFAHVSSIGAGMVTNSPAFVDFAGNDFRLAPNSPCVNTGLNQVWMYTGADLEGKSRIDKFSGRVDMGCYEYLSRGLMFKVR